MDSNRKKEDNNDKESESSSDSENGSKGPNIPPNPPSDSATYDSKGKGKQIKSIKRWR